MSFNSLLNQPITLYSRSGFDAYGKETFGAGVSHNARVQLKSRVVEQFSAEGRVATQYVTEAIIDLKSDVTVNEGDKITFNSVNYRVQDVSPKIDGRGNTHHIVVKGTKWNI